jgi:hypothetical protein
MEFVCTRATVMRLCTTSGRRRTNPCLRLRQNFRSSGARDKCVEDALCTGVDKIECRLPNLSEFKASHGDGIVPNAVVVASVPFMGGMVPGLRCLGIAFARCHGAS